MTHNRVYLSPPHMTDLERTYLQEAFDSNWIAPLGPMVDAFEQEICDYTGAKHALAVSSGTAAIHLALIHLGVGRGDEVFVSTLTFSASVNPIVYQGATPVFIDSEATSWNIDPDLLAQALHERAQRGKLPKAVIVVHLYGQSADMTRILAICNRYGVPVVEDAAESMGTTYGDRHTGTFGRAGIFSFNGNKIITTSGGGMLVSDDKRLVDHARKLSTQARDAAPHYEHSEIGYNYRMSNLLAAVGRGQLQLLDERVTARRRVFNEYRRRLNHLPGVSFMPEPSWGCANRWLTVMTIDPDMSGTTPTTVRLALEEANIEARPVWKPMHLQPIFQECEAYGGRVAEQLFATGLCLPSGSSLTEHDLTRVIETVEAAFVEELYFAPASIAESALPAD